MVSLAIVIPVFNGLEFTKVCIQRLNEQIDLVVDKADVKIIVFDDGSTDGTAEWISENYSKVIILRGDGAFWWSRSMNESVQYILDNNLADYILWWNNDIEPAKDYLQNLIELLPKTGMDTVLGSKIYVKSTGQVWGMGGKFNRLTGNKYQYAYFVNDNEKYNQPVHVDWLPGMGTIAHKSVYADIGLIDADSFPQYHGDLDFTFRARLKGYKIIVYPGLRIYNDTANTGTKRKSTWKELRQTMKSIKSLYNWEIDLKLYNKFTYVPLSYISLITKYGKFTGGFLKWKMLEAFGISKSL